MFQTFPSAVKLIDHKLVWRHFPLPAKDLEWLAKVFNPWKSSPFSGSHIFPISILIFTYAVVYFQRLSELFVY